MRHLLVLFAIKQGEADDHIFAFTQEALHSHTHAHTLWRKKYSVEKHNETTTPHE